MRVLIALLVLAIAAIAFADYPQPPPTFEASDYTTWHKRFVQKSRRADINVNFKAADGSDDNISMTRLDLVGSVYERGYAQGFLLAKGKQFHNSRLNFH